MSLINSNSLAALKENLKNDAGKPERQSLAIALAAKKAALKKALGKDIKEPHLEASEEEQKKSDRIKKLSALFGG